MTCQVLYLLPFLANTTWFTGISNTCKLATGTPIAQLFTGAFETDLSEARGE